MNIFNQRSALKEKITVFIKQQKEDYKDKHLYNFILQELFKEDFKGFTKKAFKKIRKSKVLRLYLLLRIYRVWVQYNRGKNLYLLLYFILQENKLAIQPIEEIYKYKNKYGQFISSLINTRLRELK